MEVAYQRTPSMGTQDAPSQKTRSLLCLKWIQTRSGNVYHWGRLGHPNIYNLTAVCEVTVMHYPFTDGTPDSQSVSVTYLRFKANEQQNWNSHSLLWDTQTFTLPHLGWHLPNIQTLTPLHMCQILPDIPALTPPHMGSLTQGALAGIAAYVTLSF
jgi:hypothetical protein